MDASTLKDFQARYDLLISEKHKITCHSDDQNSKYYRHNFELDYGHKNCVSKTEFGKYFDKNINKTLFIILKETNW